MTTRSRDVRTFDNLDALSEAAADEIVRLARESVRARGRFSVALAGGNTPRATYELLATRHRDAIDWQHTVVVFGDERFVPADDPHSNYRMAREALLSRVPIPPPSILAVPTDARTVDDAARRYDAALKQALRHQAPAATVDLALLGVGPDGHTASLFPGTPALIDRAHWALPVAAPTAVQPAVPRVTTTLPFLDGARTVMFLVAGKDKQPVMREILSDAESARRYPAALVASPGRMLWMIDRSAMPDDRSNA